MIKQKHVALDGARAVAEAMRQTNPDVVAAYPITPQTEIVQTFAQFVADGRVDTEFVAVESEHAAMSACIGASAAGGRVQTATTSAGMALMWEMLYVAAGLRQPIVMHFVNRALSAPINIHCDHSDSMGARDSGFVQIFAENAQEAYDNAVQSPRIAEALQLPVMHTQDGFIISHGVERVEILPDEEVKKFIGPFKPQTNLLDAAHPISVGNLDLQDYLFEHKRQQLEAMAEAPDVILKVGKEYGKLTGRPYAFTKSYKLEDAEVVVVALGSTAGTARTSVDSLRKRGVKAGVLGIRSYRPFPVQEVARLLGDKKAIAVLDRSAAFGAPGQPLFMDICSSLFIAGKYPKVVNYIFGLGGRDTTAETIETAFNDLVEIANTGKIKRLVGYLGLRE